MLDENRIKYIDTLKVVAILCIISLHVFQVWWGHKLLSLDLFRVLSEVVRAGVPLFLMITGALLLNREIEIKSFLKKKWIRLCYPFIFYWLIRFSLSLKVGNIFVHNWYFWMIFGLFLAIPLINKIILNSSRKELEYFIAVIFIASIVSQLFLYTRVENFFDLSFFLGPISFLVLGYYLSVKEFNMSTNRIVAICLLLFIIVTCIKMAGVGKFIPVDLTRNYESAKTIILSSWLDVGIFELIQAGSIFVLVKYLHECKSGICGAIKNVLEKQIVNRFLISVSKSTYGMYLINVSLMLVCESFVKYLPLSGKRIALYSIILIIGVFFISWIIVVILSRIPVIKKFSGYS